MSAASARSQVVHSTNVAIAGRAWPAKKRAWSSSGWLEAAAETVGRTSTIRGRGTFGLTATPSRRGTDVYHVVASSDPWNAVAAASTCQFVIRGS